MRLAFVLITALQPVRVIARADRLLALWELRPILLKVDLKLKPVHFAHILVNPEQKFSHYLSFVWSIVATNIWE